jgi:predicted RNA binding protein with dsRBD fold (UPF0201 family)/cytidylate kinase
MKIIAFVGLPLSGKSTATEVAREFGIPIVVMGDVVREEAVRRGVELTDENLGKIASELRQKEGMDAIAKRCIPRIREVLMEKGVVIIDGIRGIDEIKKFREAFGGDFVLIGIEAPLEMRYERARMRKRSDDVQTIDDLRTRDERELSWGMSEALEMADFTVENTGDLNEFKEKIRALLDTIISKIEVEIETDVYPTEDENKVIQAVKNIFPDAEISIEGNKLYARARDVDKFRDLLRKQKILDTARSEIQKGRRGAEVLVYLNKQTATVSRINFCDEDLTLSPLRVTFKLYNVPFKRFLDYIAPETKNGRPVKEIERL